MCLRPLGAVGRPCGTHWRACTITRPMLQRHSVFSGLDTGHAVPEQGSYPLDNMALITAIWLIFT